jgi:hypothetical protein
VRATGDALVGLLEVVGLPADGVAVASWSSSSPPQATSMRIKPATKSRRIHASYPVVQPLSVQDLAEVYEAMRALEMGCI